MPAPMHASDNVFKSVVRLIRRFARPVACAIALTAMFVPGAQAFVRNGIYEAAKQSNCAGTNDCQVVFGKVPTGKTLQLTHMSCWGQFPDTVELLVLGLDGSPRHSFVVPTVVGSGNGYKNFAANAEVLKLYIAGQKPALRLVLTGAVSGILLECQIAGQLKP